MKYLRWSVREFRGGHFTTRRRLAWWTKIIPPKDNGEYKPAESWDGLEWIGGKSWQKQRRESQRDPVNECYPLVKRKYTLENYQSRLRQCTLEVCVLQKLVNNVTNALEKLPVDRDLTQTWRVYYDGKGKDNKVGLVDFGNGIDLAELLKCTDTTLTNVDVQVKCDLVTNDAWKDQDKWRRITIANDEMGFWIFKRFWRITGHRISEAQMFQSECVGHVCDDMLKSIQESQQLSERLHANESLMELGNVTIRNRRMTRLDREQCVGRLKCIIHELTRMNLPVLISDTREIRDARKIKAETGKDSL